MEILAHRGYWLDSEGYNKMESLERAISSGFGIETDIRDFNGELVISHNIADSSCSKLEKFFAFYKEQGSKECLALNVKADGIQGLLKTLLQKYGVSNYFLFDMSIPELVVNDREHLDYYTRHSDIESECVMYERAKGVWVDSFYDEKWLNAKLLHGHVGNGKEICIVSPELHGNSYEETWKMIKNEGLHKEKLVKLCTNLPEKARGYFNDED